MIFAIGRLLFIFIITVLCLVLTVFGLRSLGLRTANTELHHPLFLQTPWVIADGGDETVGPSQSLPALLSAANYKSPHVLLGLHIRLSSDGHWILYAPPKLETLTTGHGFINRKSLEELKKINFINSTEKIMSLDETFKKIPHAQFYIEILQPANTYLNEVFNLIKKYNLEDKLILTSPFADTLREIREKSGVWLTGASTIELRKVRLMASLFLEPAIEIQADVFEIPKSANPRLIAELLRRKKVLLLRDNGESSFSEEFYSFLQQHQNRYGAILTTHPNNYRQLVDRPSGTH